MGFRKVDLFGLEVMVSVPDGVGQRLRSRMGLAGIAPDGALAPPAPPAAAADAPPASAAADALRRRVAAIDLWYHTIDLGHGVVTPGVFDHRAHLHRYGLPERLDGLRALDVATFNGFWAFELERRGAAEVVAIDLDRVEMLDLPVPVRRGMSEAQLQKPIGEGFQLCKEVLGSRVRRQVLSLYDLAPGVIGRFDFVFLSAVLQHVMNPMRALQNVQTVTGGTALIVECFDPNLPGSLMEYKAGEGNCVWWRMSYGSLERMVRDAGFRTVELVGKFPLGRPGEKPWMWHAAFRCTV